MEQKSKLFFYVLSVLVLTHCGNQAGLTVSRRPLNGAVYDNDSRLDMKNVKDPTILFLAKASVALIASRDLQQDPHREDFFSLLAPSVGAQENLCDGERFEDQSSAAHCSGTLIDATHILTAGHCVQSQEFCNKLKFVFNYEEKTGASPVDSIAKKDVYSCKSLVSPAYVKDKTPDMAIIELTTAVVNVTPIEMEWQNSVSEGDSVFAIGYPSGSPKKLAQGQVLNVGAMYFRATIDTFAGNSGSPIFSDKTKRIVGILKGGALDYVEDTEKSCNRVNICKESTCRGELVLRTASLKNYFEQILPKH